MDQQQGQSESRVPVVKVASPERATPSEQKQGRSPGCVFLAVEVASFQFPRRNLPPHNSCSASSVKFGRSGE
jgi:hypothetical protein